MASGQSFCELCRENLQKENGSFVCTVPFFSQTFNKEFSNALNGKPVVIAELLLDIGIGVVQDRRSSVCKRCARKIVNCYKLFTELQQAFIDSSGSEAFKENSCTRLKTTDKSNKEKNHVLQQHQRSPTGTTPMAKRQKAGNNNTTAENTKHSQEPERRSSSKKLLFGNKPEDKYLAVNDQISSRMDMPTETLPPICKVRMCSLGASFFSARY